MHHASWCPFILCWLQGKDCCRQGHILKHCFRDELTRIKKSFVKNIHSFSHYISGILTMDPDNFQTSLSSKFYFSNLLTTVGWTCCVIHPQHNLSEKFDIYAWNTQSIKGNIRQKKSIIMCQNAFFQCLQEIKMLRSKKEEQKTDVWSAKKMIQQSQK